MSFFDRLGISYEQVKKDLKKGTVRYSTSTGGSRSSVSCTMHTDKNGEVQINQVKSESSGVIDKPEIAVNKRPGENVLEVNNHPIISIDRKITTNELKIEFSDPKIEPDSGINKPNEPIIEFSDPKLETDCEIKINEPDESKIEPDCGIKINEPCEPKIKCSDPKLEPDCAIMKSELEPKEKSFSEIFEHMIKTGTSSFSTTTGGSYSSISCTMNTDKDGKLQLTQVKRETNGVFDKPKIAVKELSGRSVLEIDDRPFISNDRGININEPNEPEIEVEKNECILTEIVTDPKLEPNCVIIKMDSDNELWNCVQKYYNQPLTTQLSENRLMYKLPTEWQIVSRVYRLDDPEAYKKKFCLWDHEKRDIGECHCYENPHYLKIILDKDRLAQLGIISL